MNSARRCPTCLLAVATALVALVTAGCAGPRATATHSLDQPLQSARVAAKYRQVFLTGSHIPVLVPVSPTARMVPTVSPLVILTPEELVRAFSPSASPMH